KNPSHERDGSVNEYNGQTVKTQKGFDWVDSQKIMVLNILDASRFALEGYCNPLDRAFDLLDYQFIMCLRR
ncbi:MAG: hypothetical protein ACKO7A_01570, partial [Microcystis sp.]